MESIMEHGNDPSSYHFECPLSHTAPHSKYTGNISNFDSYFIDYGGRFTSKETGHSTSDIYSCRISYSSRPIYKMYTQ
jgi:hypothetical protein